MPVNTTPFCYFGYGPEADPAFMAELTGSSLDRMYSIASTGSMALDQTLSVQTLEEIPNDPAASLGGISAGELLHSQWGDDFVAPVIHDDSQDEATGTYYEGLDGIELGFIGEWNLDGIWKRLSSVQVRVPIRVSSVGVPVTDERQTLTYSIGDQFSRRPNTVQRNRQHLHFPMGKTNTFVKARAMREQITRDALLAMFE